MSAPSAPPSSLIQALRTETAELHVALEKRLPFFSEQLDIDLYRRLIAAYHGFYQPLERQFQVLALAPTGLDQSLRIKLPVLRMDLMALGLDETAIEALPACQRLPQIHSPAAALGVSYVLEGATLGGQIPATQGGRTVRPRCIQRRRLPRRLWRTHRPALEGFSSVSRRSEPWRRPDARSHTRRQGDIYLF
jgi:hypothetical protein